MHLAARPSHNRPGAVKRHRRFYAPVVTRFVTYDVKVSDACAAYMNAVQALPAMREWTGAALAERCFIPEEEPYRSR